MRDPKQILTSLLTALVGLALVLGGILLSLAEGQRPISLPSPLPPTAILPLPLPTLPSNPTIPLPPPTQPPTLPPSPVSCPPPTGWIPLTVQPGQTLASLAEAYRLSIQDLKQANCLLSDSLLPGVVLYVPPIPTTTPIPCGPPLGWIPYVVQKGDTLYSLAKYYGVTVAQLQQANCLGASTLIVAGQVIYVPNLPMRTPSEVPLPTDILTSLPTDTPTLTCTPSAWPTDTAEPPSPTSSP